MIGSGSASMRISAQKRPGTPITNRFANRPRKGEFTVRTEDVFDLIEKNHDSLAIVWIAGVNFFTGQLFDIPTITKAAQKHGIIVGFDLAHAAGNVPLAMHDWNVDFAVWCT